MAFLIRYFDPNTGFQVQSLHPRPTEVDYPEKRLFKTRPTKDGATVIQRPMRDSRPRKWIWKGYRPWITEYESLWNLLSSLEVKSRWNSGLAETTVQIWENEVGGGFNRTTDGLDPDLITYNNILWTTVKFVQVHRTPRGGGGPVTYEQSYIEFLVEDDDYAGF